jgi:hypothetical protein
MYIHDTICVTTNEYTRSRLPHLTQGAMSNERECYTILVSGTPLIFTKDQIRSDPGNYFDTFFFGDFAEGTEGARKLIIEKDVQLFKLIQAHLRGYEIIPLADTAIPWYMTAEGAVANLLSEAQFYALDNLVAKIVQSREKAGTRAVKEITGREKYMLATVSRFT